mmetsp:Transcript_5040/g.10997  ORF Transcript_5040/g.10997 Transcript_5040/m.10997 type:complete len:646 (-) Transcript_5040:24-1961(-)
MSNSSTDSDIENAISNEEEEYLEQEEETPAVAKSHRPGFVSHNSDEKLGCGKGIIKDFKQTVGTWWCQEMSNFSLKTVGVSIFLFFAAVAPAITFGAIYQNSTNSMMGAIEMLLATAWQGIVYGLVGGQPMMINGATGPVLAIQTVLFEMSNNMDIPFLCFNAWVGIWLMIYLIFAAFVDLNRLMKHLSRFTDEIFASLIASIFILDALGNPLNQNGVYWYFVEDHKSHDAFRDDPNYDYLTTAFLSLTLMVGTTATAFLLRSMKHARFFPNQSIRNIICDFAVFTSIVAWVCIGNFLFSSVQTEKLNVPDTFAPTLECCDASCHTSWPADCPDQEAAWGRRPWLVNLMDTNGKPWAPVFCAVPAIFAFILVFLDDGITWHLVNHPANKLTHGDAYNYDTVVLGIMAGINSILGLPWLVASTVPSVIHIQAMAEKDKNGRITHAVESRLTHIGIHLLIGASVFALNVLKMIPVPVLYGVFLFMGIVSLSTNEFWQRFKMFFMQGSRLPDYPFTKYLPKNKIHMFTFCQVLLFILLTVFRSVKVIAIAFAVVIKICIPIRMYLLPRWFTEEELILLDGEDDEIEALVEKFENDGHVEEIVDEAEDQNAAFNYTTDAAYTVVPARTANKPRRRRKLSASLKSVFSGK